MHERLMQYIGLPAAIAASVALTWANFSGMGLVLRLVSMLILALVVQELLARSLATRAPKLSAGFRPQSQNAKNLSRAYSLTAFITLAAASMLLSFLAWLQTERLIVSAIRSERNGVQSLYISGAWIEAEKVIIFLPPPPVHCDFTEEGASLTEIDWDQPVRTLRIDKFVAPQSVTISCAGTAPLGQRGLVVYGPAKGPYFGSDIKRFNFLIAIMGILTWVYGVLRLRRRRR